MVIIGMIDQTDSFRMTIDDIMSQLEEGCQSMIGWGAGLACMTGLVNVVVIFQGTKKNVKKWQMHGFSMSLYFAGMLILIGWSQGKFATNRYRKHSFPSGVPKD